MNEKIKNVIENIPSSTNKELEETIIFIEDDFYKTKELLIKLSHHFDNLTKLHDELTKEYIKRNGK